VAVDRRAHHGRRGSSSHAKKLEAANKIGGFNHRCLHSSLGWLTPAAAESAHYAATTALHPEPQSV
jgi:transposase InsO family protein